MTIIIDREVPLGLFCFRNPMTIIIIIDREYSRSILFLEPYDYYYRPRVLSVYFVFGTL